MADGNPEAPAHPPLEDRTPPPSRGWLERAKAAGLLALALAIAGSSEEGWRLAAWRALAVFVLIRSGLAICLGALRGPERGANLLAALGAIAAFVHGLGTLSGPEGSLPLAGASAALAALCAGRFLEAEPPGPPPTAVRSAGRIAFVALALGAAGGTVAAWTLWGGHAGRALALPHAAAVLLSACPRAIAPPFAPFRPGRVAIGLLYHAAVLPVAIAGLCPPAVAAVLSALARVAAASADSRPRG